MIYDDLLTLQTQLQLIMTQKHQ